MIYVAKRSGQALASSQVMRKTGVTETETGSNDSTVASGGRVAMAETVKVVNGASSRSRRSVAGRAETTGTLRTMVVM